LFNDDWLLTLKAENILDDAYEFTQGGQTTRSYKDGWALSVDVSWNLQP
jgi:hypothetical protein